MEQTPTESSIILYQEDGRNVPVEVTYKDETFWLPQKTMAELFNVNVRTISEHLQNIFSSGELDENSVIRKFRITAADGKSYRTNHYNLDAIIAVGYRVNSKQATRFRQWATTTLREYIIKGFVLNDDMLKNGRPFGKDYFDELLTRIRDIRASERRFWQKITDLFQEVSVDYDSQSQAARDFYATIQNRIHYATSGHTAAEIIHERVDANKPHMGLTTWKDSPEGRIHSSDVTIAKNYLSQEEIEHMNQLVSGLLDAVEMRVRNHQLTTMSECSSLVDQYIEFVGGKVLDNRGHRSKKQADRKALEEFKKFNETQDNDFEKMMKHITKSK